MDAAGRLPSSELLTLERARGVGNVVGMDVADQMSEQGLPGAGNLTQNKNVMSGVGAAKAADQKHFVEQGYQGNLTSSTDPAKVAQAQQKVDDGEQSRMAALGEIFMTLRSALEAKDPSLLADPGSPLTELAQAFDSWLRANLPGDDGKVSTQDLKLAKRVLGTKLRAFMRSRRGV